MAEQRANGDLKPRFFLNLAYDCFFECFTEIEAPTRQGPFAMMIQSVAKAAEKNVGLFRNNGITTDPRDLRLIHPVIEYWLYAVRKAS